MGEFSSKPDLALHEDTTRFDGHYLQEVGTEERSRPEERDLKIFRYREAATVILRLFCNSLIGRFGNGGAQAVLNRN